MLRFFLIILSVLVVDQGSKYLVRWQMDLGESIPLIENLFHLTYIENPEAAFGT